MGSIGPTEIILILIVVLLVFGAKKLPEIGRSFGKGLREFKKATKEITETLVEEPEKVINENKNDRNKSRKNLEEEKK